MIFNIVYGILSFSLLTFVGCQKANRESHSTVASGLCSGTPPPKPLESCKKSLDSLQDQASAPHLKSTELTFGQFDYSSGEIIIDRKLKSGERLRVHAIESACIDPSTGKVQPRIDLICQENVANVPTKIEISQSAPRMINVMRDERTLDTWYRGIVLQTPVGTLKYDFTEAKEVQLGKTRTQFEQDLSAAFTSHYFIRQSQNMYIFVGRKLHPDGSTETIRFSLKKNSGSFSNDALVFDPTPDSIFKI